MKNTIPVHNLRMDVFIGAQGYSEEIMHGEIEGLIVFHKAYTGKGNYNLVFKEGYATFLLVLRGTGLLIAENEEQALDEASIVLLPNSTNQACISLVEGQTLHFLEMSKEYSAEDKESLKSQRHQLNELYYTRFQDCTPYVEKIKSPNTISRTVLPGGVVPRVALGTVEAAGPDKVGAHSHPMLEQLFLGLTDNAITVYADDAMAEMKEFSLLHIPLGSTHWVGVADNCKMNYVWMDFFLTKDGEVWLDTHKPIAEDNPDLNVLKVDGL